jgi:hypothetical protein
MALTSKNAENVRVFGEEQGAVGEDSEKATSHA